MLLQTINLFLLTLDGKIIEQYTQSVVKGLNTFSINYDQKGTLLYQIITDANTLTGKLIAQ